MIFAALGGNLPVPGVGNSRDVIEKTIQVIDANVISVIGRSPLYRSAPVPASDQPDFVNGVISLATALSAEDLLARFHEIERDFGRVRAAANAARTLDIDLIDYCGSIVSPPEGEAGLTLPHPRLQERAFVLFPLFDLAPDWVDPRNGRSIRQLLASLPSGQACRRISS